MKFLRDLFTKIRTKKYEKKIMESITVNAGKENVDEVIHTNSLVVKVATHANSNDAMVTVMHVGTSKTGKKVWVWTKYEYDNNVFTEQPKRGTYPYDWMKK